MTPPPIMRAGDSAPDEDTAGGDSPRDADIGDPALGDFATTGQLVLVSLAATSVSATGFVAVVEYLGDDNSNGAVMLRICNETDSPACNPASATALSLQRNGGRFELELSMEDTENDPGDVLRLLAEASDPDGTDGSPLEATVQLVGSGPPDLFVYDLTTANVTKTSFDAAISFRGDENYNATVELYHCNATANTGCDPTSNTPVAMSRSSFFFHGRLEELQSPGDTLKLRVVAMDPEGVSGSPLDGTVLLQTHVYRSVAARAAGPLASGGSSAVNLTDSMAAFEEPLPDYVGLGDVLIYDSSESGAPDALGIVHARLSSTQLVLRTAEGAPLGIGPPVETTSWSLWRAYVSLADAEEGCENIGIPESLRDFDTWIDGHDLVTADCIWNMVLFESTHADAGNVSVNGWQTAPGNYLKLHTPTSPLEVGANQRHDGTWGNGYRLEGGLTVNSNYVRIEGVSIQSTSTTRSIFIRNTIGTGEIHVSNCFAHNLDPLEGHRIYDVYLVDPLVVKMWNNIGISDSANTGAFVFYINDDNVVSYLYNNTGIANGGAAFRSAFDDAHLKNNLGFAYGAGGSAFSWPAANIESCASNDDTADDSGGTGNRINVSFTFVDEAHDDYRLASTDTGAIDAGIDLSSDTTLPLSDDIHGQPREEAWDIGADELATTPGVTQLLLSNLAISDVTPTSFSIAARWRGDINGNGSASLAFCNASLEPGCDPEAGNVMSMNRGADNYTAAVADLAAPHRPGDQIFLRVRGEDPDGVVGHLSGSLRLPIPIYRSVGHDSLTALTTGAGNALSLAGNTADFATSLPARVGVGDALLYDIDGLAGPDAVAFIHERLDPSRFRVQGAAGDEPIQPGAAADDEDWSVYRAYACLADAEAGRENPGIDSAVGDFDTWQEGRDLVAAGEQWNIACYGDSVEDGALIVQDWVTGPHNYLRLFTPTEPSEVGISQRHTGIWGTGWRTSARIRICENYVRLDGLSVQATYTPLFVTGFEGKGDVRISNCFAHYPGTTNYRVYDVFNVGLLEVRLSNNIGISDSADATSRVFFINDPDVIAYIYNNTGVANEGAAFYSVSDRTHLKNNVGFTTGSATGLAFEGTYGSVSHCVSNDDTADDWGGTGNRIGQSIQFMDAGAADFHLAPSDDTCLGAATDLSDDPNLPVSTDIDGEARPAGGAWDVGADER